ncbi:uncharacterized protein [Halyomorpha halys]|uniref:uncharacterized protein isoform X2 n=1 Tax=Halyomorpha halys TaxID=286706 RepID=UPI0006D4FD6F|nr:uncharacterized protein LOC106677308 isoform X2 [Halyomorpha halys]
MQNHTVRPERPTLTNCADKWIRMNDKNCRATVNWYNACAELANKLNGTRRESYSSAIIENIKTSLDNYMRTSKRTLTTLSSIQRELSDVVERLLFPPRLTEKFNLQSEGRSNSTNYNPTDWDISPDTIMKVIWWLGIFTTILTIVILLILCLYCMQYRKTRQRNPKKDPCLDMEETHCVSHVHGCECSRRIWDTGEPRRPPKPPPDL